MSLVEDAGVTVAAAASEGEAGVPVFFTRLLLRALGVCTFLRRFPSSKLLSDAAPAKSASMRNLKAPQILMALSHSPSTVVMPTFASIGQQLHFLRTQIVEDELLNTSGRNP